MCKFFNQCGFKMFVVVMIVLYSHFLARFVWVLDAIICSKVKAKILAIMMQNNFFNAHNWLLCDDSLDKIWQKNASFLLLHVRWKCKQHSGRAKTMERIEQEILNGWWIKNTPTKKQPKTHNDNDVNKLYLFTGPS